MSLHRVDQTVLAERPDGHDLDGNSGDCYRACLAMLCGVQRHQVPHAVTFVSWWAVARRAIRDLLPVHDPHPSRAGILRVVGLDVLVDVYEPGPTEPLQLTSPGASR